MSKILPLISRFVPLAFILAAWRVCAGDTNFTAAEWSPMDEKAVMAAASEITPMEYSNCDSVIVEQHSVRDYQPDGTGECQDEVFTKVLTEKGRKANREQSFFIMLPYFTVAVPKLEILKADGTTVAVDVAANSKESIDNGQMAEKI